MEIKILFDNKSKEKKFASGWGFSCLAGGRILFDAGEDFKKLRENMRHMNTAIKNIEAVIISHDHLDHTGGLEGILKSKKGLRVYGCPSFGYEFKNRIKKFGGIPIEAGFEEIYHGIFLSGEMRAVYKNRTLAEQALILKEENGLSIITGCAHPGIFKIVKKIKKKFQGEKIKLLMGGFHLKDKNTEEIKNIVEGIYLEGVEKVGPAHCSGRLAKKLFGEKYKKNFVSVTAGTILKI